jgi:ABC-2 type transport system permease protein
MINKQHPPFPWPLLRFWWRRILPMWCGMALIIFLMQIAVCGIIHDNDSVKSMLKFMDMLPFAKAVLGGEALQMDNLSGLIAIGYNHPLVLVLYMLFAVGVPTGLLTGEVQRGSMELILSRFVTKTQVYVCAGLITLTGMFALVIVMFLGTVTATHIYTFSEPIPLYCFFQTAINGGLLASAVGAIALLSAAACRNRARAVGLAAAYIVTSYFIAILADWWPRMKWLSPITLFHYVNAKKIFGQQLWPVSDMCVLIGVLVAAAIAGGIVWQRRDLPL